MSKIISGINSTAEIIGNKNAPRSGSFEVIINNKLVFSKFKTGNFPNPSEIKNWL